MFASHLPWGEVLAGTLVPKLDFSADYLLIVVSIFGTTISPYLFFWQASQEVEELQTQRRIMGQFVIGARLKWLGWLATGVMALAVLALGLISLLNYFSISL